MKIISILVFVIIILILGFTGYKVYKDSIAGNFTTTPGVTLQAIKNQAEKQNLLIIFYKPNTQETRVLKPLVQKKVQSEIGNKTAPRVIYVSVEEKNGLKLLKHFGGNSSMVPIAMPVLKGGAEHVNILNPNVYPYPIDQKRLTNTLNGKVTVFKDYLDIYFNGSWSEREAE
jgi:hypothetical protein